MASIIKRGNSYRVKVKHKGQLFTKTFESRMLAKTWAIKKEAELKSYASGERGKGKTVADAFDRYAREVSPTKKGRRWETIRLEKFKRDPIAHIPLDVLQPADVAEWRDRHLLRISPASVRRELILIAAVFTQCRKEWNWLSENPVSFIKKPAPAKARDRRISADEIKKILTELNYEVGCPIIRKKQLVGAFFLLGIETGMRLGEMCALRPDDIFLAAHYVQLRETKNGTARNVPIGKAAARIVKDMLATGTRATSAVASATFQKACRKKKVKDLHFHDTRHEATTRLAKKLDIMDLARMTGHKDLKSLMIYYNATPAEIAVQLD